MTEDGLVVTPVTLNPCLIVKQSSHCWHDNYSGLARSDLENVSLGKCLVRVGEQMSIGNSYFTDCPYTKIRCQLEIVFGRDLRVSTDPYKIYIVRLINQDARLTINEIIAIALATPGYTRFGRIYGKSVDGKVFIQGKTVDGRVLPSDLIKEQERELGLPAFLNLGQSGFSFRSIIGASDEERAEFEARAQGKNE